MDITPEDREVYLNVLNEFTDNSIFCSVLLKVIYLYLQKTTIIVEDLPFTLAEKLEYRNYNDFNSGDYEVLKKYWNVIVDVAQSQ